MLYPPQWLGEMVGKYFKKSFQNTNEQTVMYEWKKEKKKTDAGN